MENTEVNSIYYRYLQMAYEYIHEFSEDSLQGSPTLFVELLHKRMESIFEEVNSGSNEEISGAANLESFQIWFDQIKSRNFARIVTTNIKDLLFDEQFHNEEIQTRLIGIYQERRYDNNLQTSQLLGLDCYATFFPLHFFYDGIDFSKKWGIYISEKAILQLATRLFHATKYEPRTEEKYPEILLLEIAYEILLRHELEHYKIEAFALNAELYLHKPIYTPYMMEYYAKCYPYEECIEEGLANSTVINSVKLNCLFKRVFRNINKAQWNELVRNIIFQDQPPCYRNYQLFDGWPKDQDPFKEKAVGDYGGQKTKLSIRSRAMNYLCNRMIAYAVDNIQQCDGELIGAIPFFANLPDNQFLRAENLVPIHLVQCLHPEDCVIGFTYPSRRQVEPIIRAFGYEYSRKNKHEIWVNTHYPANRYLALRYYRHDVLDPNSYNSTLDSLGINHKKFCELSRMAKKEMERAVNMILSAQQMGGE